MFNFNKFEMTAIFAFLQYLKTNKNYLKILRAVWLSIFFKELSVNSFSADTTFETFLVIDFPESCAAL